MLQTYLDYCELEKNLSPHTIRMYRQGLTDFFRFYGDRNIKKLSPKDVSEYSASLRQRKLSQRTIHQRIVSLKVFLAWYKMYHRDKDIIDTEHIVTPRIKKQSFSFSESEFELVEQIISWLPAGRDRLMFMMLTDTGLRISELLNLNIGDIRGDKVTIRGKGDKLRLVFLSERVLKDIKDILKDTVKDMSCPLFTNYANRRLSVTYAQRLIQKLSGGKIHPHLLRHMFATKRLQNGTRIEDLAKMLGHSSVSTTQIYLHVSDEHMERVWKGL